MPLHLEVVCTRPGWARTDFLDQDRRESVVRVIGEILPFVLAKYCSEPRPTPHTEVPNGPEIPDGIPDGPDDQLSRFRGT